MATGSISADEQPQPYRLTQFVTSQVHGLSETAQAFKREATEEFKRTIRSAGEAGTQFRQLLPSLPWGTTTHCSNDAPGGNWYMDRNSTNTFLSLKHVILVCSKPAGMCSQPNR